MLANYSCVSITEATLRTHQIRIFLFRNVLKGSLVSLFLVFFSVFIFMTFEYMETDDLIVMLGDFMLPSVKANGGINSLNNLL